MISGRASKFQEPELETLLQVRTGLFANDSAKERTGEAAHYDADAFAEIYETHKARVYSTALRILGNTADAEDVTQEVFVKAYQKLNTFEGRSQLSTWLYRITVNRCLDVLRKLKRTQTVPLEEAYGAMANPSNLKQVIESFIPSLPPGYRTVFVLHDIQGLKHIEIARLLKITEGACKSQLHKARLMMRKKLTPYIKGIT